MLFELWCWRRLLGVSWTSRRSKQSILKEIRPEYSLEGLILKLKLQCFGHLMRRTDSLEKTLMLEKIERQEENGTTEDEMVQWHHRLNGQVNSGRWWWTGKPGVLQSMRSPRVRHDWVTELDWRLTLFSFLKPWADNGSNQCSSQLLYGQGWHTLCHPISKMHETPSALRCLSYLIKSLVTDIKHLAKN